MSLKLLTAAAFVGLLSACASTQDGAASWTGSARFEKLSDSDYIVQSSTSGISGPARLRPLLLAKARELASASGYAGFVVADPEVERPRYGDGHVAIARVRLLRAPPPSAGNFEYFETTALSVAPTPQPIDPKLVAALQGSSAKDIGDATMHLHPFYLDALDREEKFAGPVRYFLKPGVHLVVAHVLYKKSTFAAWYQGSVPLRANLDPGVSYVVAGTVKEGRAHIWIENQQSGQRLGERYVPLQ